MEWACKIDDYCTDQGTEGDVYNKILIDINSCTKEDFTTTNPHLDKYSGINSELLDFIKEINRSFARDSIQRSTNPDDEARITEELRVQYTDPDLMVVRQEYEDYEMAASLARWEEQEPRQAEYGTRPVLSQLSDGTSQIPERLRGIPESSSSHQQHIHETQSMYLSDEDADLERAIRLSLELNAIIPSNHSSNEPQGISRVSRQTRPEDAVQQPPAQENLRQMIQSLEQRYPVIDVSNMTSPQTIDVITAVQQQTQRIWRLIRRRST